jgi:hypothetical protein
VGAGPGVRDRKMLLAAGMAEQLAGWAVEMVRPSRNLMPRVAILKRQ